jgi:hypothetical protein
VIRGYSSSLSRRGQPVARALISRRQVFEAIGDRRPRVEPRLLGGVVNRRPGKISQGPACAVDLARFASHPYRQRDGQRPVVVVMEVLKHGASLLQQ